MVWPGPALMLRPRSANSRAAAERAGASGLPSRSWPERVRSTGAPSWPRFLASLIRLSRRSQANAAIRPMSRPAARPPGSTIVFFGLLALPGGVALVRIEPPEDAASWAVSAAAWLASALSWLLAVCTWASALARWGEFTGSEWIWMVSWAVRRCKVASSPCTVRSCALVVLAALAVRLRRYAAPKALAHAAADRADAAWQPICSTEEFAGTVTKTWATSAVGVSGECRARAAIAATAPDWMICTSVSRLIALLVRPLATEPPWFWASPTLVTLTVVVAV